ncbi:metallophosphoesterase [Paracoccus sp. CPCC 101403]|uniref:Metallophosphoesterase n=1 Tax=Paracoccus broussonetiae TaxID=3075834 RepID=A0ABU3EHS7_9RHOB|nr:metallophosphoesterase [Paracoccus sp. CPCC 101403]MDT1063651.1 metallophosphoesterase [Paracoccus sp. CPCC 101403]
MTAIPELGRRTAGNARVLIVADLHLDQWKHDGLDPLEQLDATEWQSLDGVIVAGDLSNAAMRKWPRFLDRLAKCAPPGTVHVMPGNHDYYDLDPEADPALAELCRQHGVGFAQMAELRIAGELFLCATLWSDFVLPADPKGMDDFRRIRSPAGGPLQIGDLQAVHRRHLAWLDDRLTACEGRATVVTHHLPHPSLLPPDYRHPGGFASDLGWLMRKHRPREWLFGHAHGAPDAIIEEVPCRNVALGPPSFRGPDASARLNELIR